MDRVSLQSSYALKVHRQSSDLNVGINLDQIKRSSINYRDTKQGDYKKEQSLP